MPREHPFLVQAAEAGQDTRAAVPDALFDLAVNRAATVLRIENTPDALASKALAQWHARTRFARRVPLETIRQALMQKPQEGPQESWHWKGGPEGGWQPGRALFP